MIWSSSLGRSAHEDSHKIYSAFFKAFYEFWKFALDFKECLNE
jgi:hypothetical protein